MSRMETCPASISFGQESAQMWSLNKRLEAYLSRVKALEEENELLRAEIHHLKGTRSDRSLVREYHDEIMKLRDALDDEHQEMVQVETDRDCLYQEVEYVKELCLQEKQAQEDVKKELSKSKKLLEEEKRSQMWLKERLMHLEQEMEDILKTHEEDKALMEEEISSYSQRLENFRIAPVNFKPVNVEDYANQLSQIWQGAVEEYKIEVSALETNLSQAKENLQKVLDENKQGQLQLQNLERDLQSLKGRKEMLEELLAKQWLEQQDEEGRLQLEIETLEKEKEDLRAEIAQVLEDRQQLMHLKMSLSLEVATYRSLLEAESTRLNTPSADYKLASSFSDSVLKQKTFRKSRHENTKPLVSRDKRLNANKKLSAETSSTNRYLNVKSSSFSNTSSPVTKEFQKVSSVLQSQGLNYTKASSDKAVAPLPSVESNLGRSSPNGDVFKKSKAETISHFRDFSKPVTKETMRKDADIQPDLNRKTYNMTDAGLKKTDFTGDAKGESLPPTANETVNVQAESSSKFKGKHIEVISDFGLEEQQYFMEAPNKDKDTLAFEKPQEEKTDFEVPVANDERPGEDFQNTDEEHIKGKQEVVGQIVSCQRMYIEKEELVEPLEYENIETSVKVNNEEFRKVLDFSKPNTQDLDEPNVLSSDDVSRQGIEYALNQELDFDTRVSLNNADVDNASQDKEDIIQEADEEKENFQRNKGLELSYTEETSNYVEANVDLQVEDVSVDQKFHVLSSPMEDINRLIDDGQNFTKDIHDEEKTEKEEYNENPEKDTKEVSQDTNIQEYNDNELGQQASGQEEDILEADRCIDGKQEHTQFDQERQEGFEVRDASESRDHPSDEDIFKTESKKEEESCECEENIINAEHNIQDSIDIEQSRILVTKEVYQYNSQVLDDLKEIQLQSQEEKNNFELNDLGQNTQSYEEQQKSDVVQAPQETTQEFSHRNQEESEDQGNKDVFDQRDNVQEDVSQLSEDVPDSPQPGLEEPMSVDLSSTEQESEEIVGYYIENNQVVQTPDSKEGASLLDIHPDSKQEELHDIMQEEMVIEKSNVDPQSVQSTPEHNIRSSEGEELERDWQALEKDLTEEKTGDINTSLVESVSSELKDVEEDKDDVSEENYEVCTTVEYTKSITTEAITKSIDKECESYEEDNVTEKEGPTPAYEEDSCVPEHEAEKEQEQGKEHYQVVSAEAENKDYKDKEEDKQLFQERSDVELSIAKEEGSSLQQDTEPIVEKRSEASTDMEKDNAKFYDHQNSEVDEDQPSDKEACFQHENEDLIQSDEGHEESSKVALTAEEYAVSKEVETKQSIEKDYDIMEEAQANSTLETDTNAELNAGAGSDPEGKSSFQQEVEEKKEEGQASNHQEVEERQEGYDPEVETGQEVEEGKEGYHQKVVEGQEGYHQEVQESQEDYHQVEKEGKESGHQAIQGQEVIFTINKNVASEEDNKRNQSLQKDYDEEQYVGFSLNIIPTNLKFTSEHEEETQPEQEQSSKFSEGIEAHRDEIHVHEEEQTKDDFILEEKEKEQEVSESKIIHQQSTYPLEHECENILLQNSKSHVVLSKNLTKKYDFDEPTQNHLTEFNEMEGTGIMENDNSKSEDSMDSKESYRPETEETQESYHQEVEVGEESHHQEEEDQLGVAVISTLDENIASEEDHRRNQPIQEDSDVEQNVGVSLKIFPNILRFTSENDAEAQPEQQEQSRELSYKGTETWKDEIHQEEFENVQQNYDIVLKEKEQEISENEITHQQSTFPLEPECENLLLENVVLGENLDLDKSTEERLTELDETEAADNLDNDNSKSEDSMDSQDISIYSQKSEFEISKDYQLEQTLPDTTPLPSFDDEFEELTEDEIILASKQAAEITKLQSSANGAEAEEVLDSILETQSSQVLPKVSKQSNLIKDDHEDYYEQQDENTKGLFESEHPQHFVDPRLNTEDSSGTLDAEEPAPKPSEDPVDSKMDAANSNSEGSTASQEEVEVCLPKVDEFGASKDSQLEKTQFETISQENQAQLSSEQLVSESVNEDHNDKPEERRPTLVEDTNEENVLTKTLDFVPSSEETKLVPSLSHEGTTENKDNIMKEHSDLVTQDVGLNQSESLEEKVEPQTSSDEEKDLLVERSDSSFASMKEHEDTSEFMTEYSEDGKTLNGIFGHAIVQATLDFDDHIFNGHSAGENSEIIISEAKMVRVDGDIVNSQSQDKIEDSVIEFTKWEGKSEGLFQSLLETSELEESLFDEASEAKNIMQASVKYVDSASEQSSYTKKLINPYLTERDLQESSEIKSSVMDEDLVNTKQEVNEAKQCLKINQEHEDAWSSDE